MNKFDIDEEKYINEMISRREQWKIIFIDGKRTNYRVSNLGKVLNKTTGKIFDSFNKKNEYTWVHIRVDDKTVIRTSIHRLVAMSFCKIPIRHREAGLTFKDLVPNHKDGIKHHSSSFNLEWVTPKENNSHAWRTGLCNNARGENNHLAKITEKDAITICELIMEKKNNAEIEDITGISKNTIQHIRSGECWKHISSNYDFPKLAEDKKYTISLETIHAICKDLEKKEYSDYELARKHGVNREYVRDLRTHRRRTSITKDYNF